MIHPRLRNVRLNFYPRSPCGERPWTRGSRVTYVEFLSTLSLRRATEQAPYRVVETQISIHALLAESDASHFMPRIGTLHFYPRSPCGERLGLSYFYIIKITFLSTLSLRRATIPLQ